MMAISLSPQIWDILHNCHTADQWVGKIRWEIFQLPAPWSLMISWHATQHWVSCSTISLLLILCNYRRGRDRAEPTDSTKGCLLVSRAPYWSPVRRSQLSAQLRTSNYILGSCELRPSLLVDWLSWHHGSISVYILLVCNYDNCQYYHCCSELWPGRMLITSGENWLDISIREARVSIVIWPIMPTSPIQQ